MKNVNFGIFLYFTYFFRVVSATKSVQIGQSDMPKPLWTVVTVVTVVTVESVVTILTVVTKKIRHNYFFFSFSLFYFLSLKL